MNFLGGSEISLLSDVPDIQGVENPIIRDFMLIRNERNGSILTEAVSPIEEYASCFSESLSSSQASELSLQNKMHPAADTTPESDVRPVLMDQFIGVSPSQSRFAPIINTDSGDSNFGTQPPEPVRGASILIRYRRLMEDLEVSQGIHVTRFSDAEIDSETDENSFTESMLAVDANDTAIPTQDLVSWLADHFKRSKRSRHSSIDGIIMSHGVSQAFHNVGHRHRHSRWLPLKPSNIRLMKKRGGNVFARWLSHWKTPKRNPNSPTFHINRHPRDRFSSYF